jgi:NAD-dependent SIR2 family protein deacetylase
MTTPERQNPAIAFRVPGTGDWRSPIAATPSDTAAQADARKAKDELKNALLASLQMQHVVVLAGSGCSRSAGGPTMRDLWNATVGEKPSDAAKATAGKVNHALDDRNIELFLSKVEAFLQVTQDQDVSAFLDSSKEAILASCTSFLEPQGIDSETLETHRTVLHRISRRRVRDHRLRVFTTNYDLCFERAAAGVGGVALDGFSFTAPRRYDPRFFGYDIIRRPRNGDDLGHYLEGVFLLYKLHGSVNWARGQDGTIYEKNRPAPAEACLIYPATGKYQQSFVQPHLESIAQYLAAVREPGTCVLVVGFGFNDDHLAEPLLAAVQSNPHLRLIVVDPGADANETNGNRYWKRLFELGGRGEDVWFIKASFAEFAKIVPDLKSLTPADTLLKAIKGAAGEPWAG